jgi:tetratricopeptide (TPR) repeat protein
MEQLTAAATSASGIAALFLLALSVVAVIAMRGQLRVFATILGFSITTILGVVAIVTTAPEGDLGSEPLAGLTTDIPDTDRELAEALMIRAEQELNSGDTRVARESYEKARSKFRQMGDVLGEASVAFGLGRLEHFTGQSDKARANYAEAASLFLQGGSAIGQARVFAAMGDLEKDTFNWDAARDNYRQARNQWDRAPTPKSDPHVLLGLEDLAAMPDGEAQARAQLEQAQLLYFQADDGVGKGDIAQILGDMEFNLGNLEAARSKYSDARATYQGTDARDKEAEANMSLAFIELHRGNNLEVSKALDFAAALFDQAENPAGGPRVEIRRGRMELMVGNLTSARNLFAQAAIDLKALSDKQEPDAVLALADALAMLGDFEGATVAYRGANELYHRFGFDYGEARASYGLGRMALANGLPRAATEHLLSARQLFAGVGDTVAAARTLATFGNVLTLINDDEGALQIFRESVPMFELEAVPVGLVIAALGTGDLSRGIDKTAEAIESYTQAFDLFAAMKFPVTEANRYLGLPAIESIGVRLLEDDGDPYQMAGEIDVENPEEIVSHEQMIADNLAAFPNQNAAARTLIRDIEARIAEAIEFVNSQN